MYGIDFVHRIFGVKFGAAPATTSIESDLRMQLFDRNSGRPKIQSVPQNPVRKDRPNPKRIALSFASEDVEVPGGGCQPMGASVEGR